MKGSKTRTDAALPGPVRFIERMSEIAGSLAAILLAALAIFMLAELGARNLFGQSLHLTWELSSYAMSGVFFLAAAAALRHADHVRVGIMLEMLGSRAARWMDFMVTVIAFLVVGYLLFAMGALTWRSFSGDVRSWSGFRIPLGWPQSILLAGIFQLWMQLIARAIRLWNGFAADADRDTIQT